MHGATFVVIPGVAARWVQGIGRKGHESGLCQPAGHVLDVRIQPAVLVHDQDRRTFSLQGGGNHEIAPPLTVPFGRWKGEITGPDVRVVEGDLFRLGVVGH